MHASSHPRQVSQGGRQGQGAARWVECQPEWGCRDNRAPGESSRGLQGVEADLRSEAKVHGHVGWERRGERAGPVLLRLVPVNVNVDFDSGLLAGV